MIVGSMLLLAALAACARNGETRVQVAVPKEVAVQAARRLAGDALAPPPILMLEGLQSGANESMTIEVLGSDAAGKRTVLAVTGLVGDPQAKAVPPFQKLNLPVPLNDEASKLMAGHGQITLILNVKGAGGSHRKPLKVDKIYFQPPVAPK